MKKPKKYNLSPAEGQALLNFQGRLYPETVNLFETNLVEEVKRKTRGLKLAKKKKELHPDFKNLLIQGDCLSACAYLKSKDIKVDLVYIDPPFASGANYAKKIYLRNGSKINIENDENSIGEEIMYSDIWQKEDYLNWLYERLLAIKEIMDEEASIYLHLDWHIGHYAKILMDEVFGEENFINELIWHHDFGGRPKNFLPRKHDTILFYSKSEKWTFNEDKLPLLPYKGQLHKYRGKEKEEKTITDVWDIAYENKMSLDNTHYITQKPTELLKRIIDIFSNKGMLVADFFVGSGTTVKVAHDLDRKFIACDIGINAIQTTRDRLVKIGAEFDILKVKDGLRLFRNPAQTTARLFGLIDGFKTSTELELGSFWDGGIVNDKGSY